MWAPNAQAVSVVGEFNEWDTKKNPMKKVGPIGVYEIFVPGAKIGQLYKFYITGAHGEELYKADPYANAAEMRPGTASRVTDITNYKWKDDTWMKNREAFDPDTSAMSIYEVHSGFMDETSADCGRRGWFLFLQRAGPEACRVCQENGLHTC